MPMILDKVACSAGSACHSDSHALSPVRTSLHTSLADEISYLTIHLMRVVLIHCFSISFWYLHICSSVTSILLMMPFLSSIFCLFKYLILVHQSPAQLRFPPRLSLPVFLPLTSTLHFSSVYISSLHFSPFLSVYFPYHLPLSLPSSSFFLPSLFSTFFLPFLLQLLSSLLWPLLLLSSLFSSSLQLSHIICSLLSSLLIPSFLSSFTSQVLSAMGIDPLYGLGTLRLSWGRHSTEVRTLLSTQYGTLTLPR